MKAVRKAIAGTAIRIGTSAIGATMGMGYNRMGLAVRAMLPMYPMGEVAGVLSVIRGTSIRMRT